MQFGFNLPTRGPLATRAGIDAMAARGEALGFSHFAVPDHLVVPRTIGSRYPYSETGAFPGADSGECLEQLTLMAYLAATTTTARLLSSVMVVPHRAAVHTAKTLATIDLLSGGRVDLGIGAGWMREEFEAIGAPPFEARGRVTDEYLAAMRELWTADSPEFDGEFVRFSDLTFLPKPAQRNGPPIWVGGESRPALRRAARIGDVWYPIGANPAHPLNTAARLAEGMETMQGFADEAKRDPGEIGVAYWSNWYREDWDVKTDTGERHLFTGSTANIIEDCQNAAALGIGTLLFNFQRDSLPASLDAIERFAADVMPVVGGQMGSDPKAR